MQDLSDIHPLLPASFPFKLCRSSSVHLKPRAHNRLIWIEKGNVLLVEEQQNRILKPGSLIFIPSAKGPSAHPLKQTRATQLCSLEMGDPIIDQLLLSCWKHRHLEKWIEQLWSRDKATPTVLLPAMPQKQEWFWQRMEQESTQQQDGWEVSILQYLLQMLVSLYREQTKDQNRHNYWQVGDLTDYIQRHYTEEFSLSELAEKYRISSSYLSALFKQQTGMPLFEYINHVRIEKACLLLKRNQQPIIDIAYAVGYNNLSFFNRYFRKIMKQSPREYRNIMQQ